MEDILEISLITLISTSTICVIVLTVFLARFLLSAYKLTKNLSEASETINGELKPVICDLKETVSGINSLVKTADNRVKVINSAINGVVGATGILGGKLKSVVQGAVEGFRAGLNLFKK